MRRPHPSSWLTGDRRGKLEPLLAWPLKGASFLFQGWPAPSSSADIWGHTCFSIGTTVSPLRHSLLREAGKRSQQPPSPRNRGGPRSRAAQTSGHFSSSPSGPGPSSPPSPLDLHRQQGEDISAALVPGSLPMAGVALEVTWACFGHEGLQKGAPLPTAPSTGRCQPHNVRSTHNDVVVGAAPVCSLGRHQ